MTIKVDFKSSFRIKNNFSKNNSKKNIFLKNMVVFLLFSKIFFKTCKVTLLLSKKKKFLTNMLKAPSRHKKFFHQIFHEIFRLRVFFFFNSLKEYSYEGCTLKLNILNSIEFFFKLNNIFTKIGSNIFSKTKFTHICPVVFGNFLTLR
jgi:hypothetical protein